jgi:mono/diheme cytochrome c family protein
MVAPSRTRSLFALALCAAAFGPHAKAADPNLGRALTPGELAGWNITVFTDGSGYPEGKGTVAHGEQVYQANCASCHGAKLEGGGLGPVLAGGKGTLASDKPVKTVGSYWPYASTLFDYIRRAMPFQAPQSLSNDEVYSVTGYVLHVNGLLPADAAVDGAVLQKVQMPNREGFYLDPRPDVKIPRCMQDCPAAQAPH